MKENKARIIGQRLAEMLQLPIKRESDCYMKVQVAAERMATGQWFWQQSEEDRVYWKMVAENNSYC